MNTLNTPSPVDPIPPAGKTLQAPGKDDSIIQDAAGWVLRLGVILSVAVMILGLTISFIHAPPSVKEMRHVTFTTNAVVLLRGVRHGNGKNIIDLGLLLLVLTPITRVAVSMVLFALVENDWFYTWVTLAVLVLTLVSLLFIH